MKNYKQRVETLLQNTLTFAEKQLKHNNILSQSAIDTIHTLDGIRNNLIKQEERDKYYKILVKKQQKQKKV